MQQPTLPRAPSGRRLTARQGVGCVALAIAVLIVAKGDAVRHAGDQMRPGPGRSVVLAVGHPTSWIADHLPVESAANRLTAWLSPDSGSSRNAAGSFATTTSRRR